MLPLPGNEGLAPRLDDRGGWDGVNDAPALTQADAASPSGADTNLAIESADVVLMRGDPYDVLMALELSQATLRKMHQYLPWAIL